MSKHRQLRCASPYVVDSTGKPSAVTVEEGALEMQLAGIGLTSPVNPTCGGPHSKRTTRHPTRDNECQANTLPSPPPPIAS